MLPPVAGWLPPALRRPPDPPDPESGGPRLLDALLAAVDAQVELLATDIERLWQDLFIESCDDWVVPYIGSLLGLPADAERREVAYAVALRRRKGTPAALEDFAEVVTGFTARVIEGWQVTLWAQRLGHPPPPRVASVDFRSSGRHRIGTPFESVRRSVSPGGRWSPAAAGVVVWPWRARTFVETEAAPLAGAGGGTRFALHPLGAEAPLYLPGRPLVLASDVDQTHAEARTQDETDAPVRATYRVLEALAAPGEIIYGGTWAVAASHPLAPRPGTPSPLARLTVGGAPVGWDAIRFGSLPAGVPAPFPPASDEVVLDIARGHVELGTGLAGTGPLRATWQRPTAGRLGALAAGADPDLSVPVVVTVNPTLTTGPTVVHTLADAFAQAEILSAGAAADGYESEPGHTDVEIRLETSDRLLAPPAQSFTPVLPRWRLVAPRLSTPTVVGDLELDLEGGCVTLEGFYLDGDLRLGAGLAGVVLRGLTMNPPAGATLDVDPGAWGLSLTAERCLLGGVRADLSAHPLVLTDCVVDGRGATLRVCGGDPGGSARDAVTAAARFGPDLRADGVTFVGPVRVEAADAVDCLFLDGVEVVQQQEGCLRHCYLGGAPASPPSLPTTYRCGPFPAPTFASVGFEAGGYYGPALEPDHPLLAAASDGGEVGAYHHARRAARMARLRRRVHEFVPLGVRPFVSLAPWEE
ncbi:MAG: phage tail protein [Acidimicrobiales bacterium]